MNIITSRTKEMARRPIYSQICVGSIRERQELSQRCNSMKAQLVPTNGDVYVPNRISNPDPIKREIAYCEKRLSEISPTSFNSDKDKDETHRICKEIESEFASTALTKDELNYKSNAWKLIKFEQNFGNKAILYKNLKRNLEPDNPEAGNLEQFRKATRTRRGRPRKA